MKTRFIVEYDDKKVGNEDVLDKVKEIWKQEGKFLKEIQTIDIYIKPKEDTCFYVINDHFLGSFQPVALKE